MANMVSCKSCGGELAKTAKTCPKCGAPNKRMGLAGKLFGGLFVLLVVSGVIGSVTGRDERDARAAGQAKAAAAVMKDAQDPAKQAQREKLIAELKKRGVFAEVESHGTATYVHVRPAFYALDFNDKQAFAGVAYMWGLGKTGADLVTLLDARTNARIGSFGSGGLQLKNTD